MLLTVLLIILVALFLLVLILWLFGERWRLLRPSTRKFFREYGWRDFFNFLHGYIYARWTNQYIKLLAKLLPPPQRVKQPLADRYHGKVLTTDLAQAVVTLNQNIPLQDLEQIIPYSTARDLVLKGPPDIAVYECCCRALRENPCQPTQVCMLIGQPIVDFILEHNPKSSRRLTQTEALELLEAERKRGHIHTAWFKDAMLGRFYAICNCCQCCCGAITVTVRYDIPMLAASGYIAQVDQDLCSACEICQKTCAFGAVKMNETAEVTWENCMGCGACISQCPNEAISLVRDERKGKPMDVRVLAKEQWVL